MPHVDLSLPQPVGAFDPKTGLWVATSDWITGLACGRNLEVKAGFRSDGASIPSVFWPLVGPRYHARTFYAALAHDALYAAHLLYRAQADYEFFRRLVLMGVSVVKARVLWAAVRSCGWVAWLNHTPGRVAEARRYVRIVGPMELVPADDLEGDNQYVESATAVGGLVPA